MTKFYLQLSRKLFLVLLFILPVIIGKSQNWGFEAPAATPPANWAFVTGTWSNNTDINYVRTGSQSMMITDPATSGTTGGNTAGFVTTTSAGSYLITIGWGKSNTAANGAFNLGYRTGSTNTLNPSSTATPPAQNILNNSTWTRITSVSTATVGAGSYGPAIRAFRVASTAGTTLYMDDFVTYASSSDVPDLSAPDMPGGGSVAGQNINWTNGNDNGSPASGVGGTVIIRADGVGHTAPVLNDQAMYATTTGAAGTSSFSDNGITWTVVASINDDVTQNYSDLTATGGPYTYIIYTRDLAYNYSPGLALTSSTAACTAPPVAGTATVSPAVTQCPGTTRILNLTGNSFGIGQTYRWLSASTENGTYTYISANSNSTSFSVNPTATTWYKAEVTCSGNTQTTAAIEVLVSAPLSGTFTINSSAVTGSGNFQNFADAIAALSCGISGPVVFNVLPGTGPYSEQVVIPAIAGSSSVNTVTFNGNNNTITFTSTNTAERAVVKLNGADYVTFDGFDIFAGGSAATEFGYGFQMVDDADNNTIKNCIITVTSTPATATSTAYAGIVINASTATTPIATGNSQCDNNTLENNTITGGYSGISIVANGATSTVTGNKVIGNTVSDFYEYGIIFNGNSGGLIEGNEIARPARTSVTTFRGITLTSLNTSTHISKNKIHTPFGSASSSTSAAFGIYINACDATAGNENIVSNNMVYNFANGTSGNPNHNGVLLVNSDHVKFYYNSILLDDATSACTTCGTRGFYMQTAPFVGLEFKNNIVVISRGGTGPKQAIYFEGSGVSFISDHNDFYIESTSGTVQTVFVNGTGYADLSAWSATGQDINSVSVDPMFVSSTDLHLQPTSQLASLGTPVTAVTVDIDGEARSASSPAIGADEFPPVSGIDLRPGGLVSPALSSTGCYNIETITVAVNNNSTNPIDLSSNSLSVTVNITGAATANYSASVNTGIIAPGGTLDVTMVTPGATLDMSAAGDYNFNIATTVGGDVNPANNTSIITRTKALLSAGTTISTSQDNYCASGLPVLTATDVSGHASFKWQHSATAGSGFTDITAAPEDPNPFTIPAAITQNTYYRAEATCGSSTNISPEILVTVNNPQITSSTPGSRCGPGTVNLNATGSGSGLSWYETATGGTALATGNTFTTPAINTTTTYYVAANDGGTSEAAGKSTYQATPNTVGNGWGLVFNVVNSPITLTSVDVFSVGSAGGNISVQLTDNTGAVLATAGPFAYPAGSTASPVQVTLPVNFSIPVGTGYRILSASNSGGALIRETSGITYPYTSGSGNVSVTSGYISGTTATTYYFFYNWQVATGCEGARTPVVATVTPPPALTVTASKTICNNSVHQLQVTSTVGDFNSYIWSPQSDLYTDAAATIPYTGTSATTVYVKSAMSGSVTYTVAALNTTSQCTNEATSTVITMPDATITATPQEICVSGASTLVLAPSETYGLAQYQWQSSPDGTSFTDIATATTNTYTTPTLTQTTYYRTILKDQSGTVCSQPSVTITVNNPQVMGTSGATRCGPGTVTLSATASTGASINWYDAAVGGNEVATGSSFTTPMLTNTTTYYAAATSGGSTQSTGLAAASSVASSGSGANSVIVFNVLAPFTLKSVDIFPVAASVNTAGTVDIKIVNATGTTVHSTTVNVTGNPSASAVANTAILDFYLAPGNDYKLVATRGPGITNLLFEPSAQAPPGGNYGYPFTVPGVLELLHSEVNFTATTRTPRLDLWYFFYNWKIYTGCEAPRIAVTATVTPAASAAAGVVGSTECATNTISSITEFNFTDCDPIVKITPSGATPMSGSADACVTIDATVQSINGERYVQRHYDITPATNAATATSTVTLYFLQSEFTAFNTANAGSGQLPSGPSDAAGKSSLRITQYNGTGTAPGNYTGTAVNIDPADAEIVWNSTAGRWEITFSATGSGGFYVHTGNFVLPVTQLNFSGELAGAANRLVWSTATETNNKGFELERSADGRNFSSLTFVATKAENGNSTSVLNYSYVDAKPFAGNNYYRLKQIDRDGKYSYSNVVMLSRKVKDITLSSVYPNPTTRELNLVITSPRAEKVTIVVTDLSGKTVMQSATQLMIGENQQTLNVQQLAAGTYIIKAICADGCETAVHRFVKR